MNNWEKLCTQVNPLIRKGVDEDLFHLQFEACLKAIFNWDDTNIKHKPQVQIGREKKQADIVLTGNGFGIVIEMKQPDIELDDEAKSQLFGYMRILKYKYGFLVGKRIVLFYDDDTIGEQPLEVASFDFDIKNSDGMALSDILDKSICSNERLMEYVNIRIIKIKEKEQIEKLKKGLLADNKAKIKEILKNALISDGYNEEIIYSVLDDIFNKNGNPIIIQPIPSSNNFLDEVMNYYNSICDQNFKCYGKKEWRLIKIIETEKLLHYEFKAEKNSSVMDIGIHMEHMKFTKLNDVISSFTGKIRGYTIGHRPVRGKDYVQILVPYSAGKEECSLVMKELINLTYEKIRDEYKKLKL
jgi:hypothetical protein